MVEVKAVMLAVSLAEWSVVQWVGSSVALTADWMVALMVERKVSKLVVPRAEMTVAR